MKIEHSKLFQPFAKINKTTFFALCAVQVAVLVFMWNTLPSPVIPRPMEIISAWMGLAQDGDFLREIVVSTSLALQSVAITVALSLLICYASLIPFFYPLAGVVSKLRFLSLVGLSFVFTMMLGGGHNLKVGLLVFGMSVFYTTSMMAIIQSVGQNELNHARTLGMNEWQVMWEVIVVGKLSDAFEVMRQNFAIAWMMLTMVEGISRAEGGIGAMMLSQNKHFAMASVFAIQGTIFTLGLLMDFGFGYIRTALFRHAKLATR